MTSRKTNTGFEKCGMIYKAHLAVAVSIVCQVLSYSFEDSFRWKPAEHRRKRKIIDFKDKDKRLWSMPVPYAFSTNFTAESDRKIVRAAISEWELETCVKFREVEDQEEYERTTVVLVKPQDSSLCGVGAGRIYIFTGNRQVLFLGHRCLTVQTVAHEFGHVLGLYHEHARPDRDRYIDIIWSNLTNFESTKKQFSKKPEGSITTLGFPYDVASLMHYGPHIYGKTWDSVTIRAKDPLLQLSIGATTDTTIQFYDAKTVNYFYCNVSKLDTCRNSVMNLQCQHGGYPDPKSCHRCRCPQGFSGDLCEWHERYTGADPCGGVIPAESFNQSIYSPNYINEFEHFSYKKGQTCNWLIKAPHDKLIAVRFTGTRFGFPCTTYPYVTCDDYVEVRYGDDIGVTGARFCCQERPNVTIISSSNEVLVLLRSTRKEHAGCGKRFGFRLNYWMVNPVNRNGTKSRSSRLLAVNTLYLFFTYVWVVEWL
ncbi:zinc metalloproteinase dpy-31 isoform X2 [Lingula anatina]|uniref:Metalloendopeptidase n=1 Tax=Lingula anatina TaxID=7574 RepID=A0A1S3J6D9_LINAN|nr:zinc metalloproteinase dpy-31 isoform X2 [Lingula anatina]|eukprot:XP_013405873.1 zinc metalloproteinase dpy-31 isoform X2 [Lingula anatina]